MSEPRLPTGTSGVTLFTLFATSGTLICCALPILLVSLGLGAAVVAMTSHFPLLISLSQHKIWVFLFSGLLLALSGWLLYRPGRRCPADPVLARACSRARRWNLRVYWTSVALFCIGFLAAYVALPLRVWLGM
ncbi:MAG TPA: hypothetical protein ENK05_08355 [Gammaproteobacteria bacterium]|nr:hypothetical protein [Gammaproteobacteria bacterium]